MSLLDDMLDEEILRDAIGIFDKTEKELLEDLLFDEKLMLDED